MKHIGIDTLFEVSWEVCNKVGGIHTVVSTKATTLCEKLGDGYVAIGPWLMSEHPPFVDEAGFSAFTERCRALGVPVRVGRWAIPGRPRTILVDFSRLFAEQDGILAGLWERFGVDSLLGGWDYVEPVLFGCAAGMVIEAWFEEYVAPASGRAVAQIHEWMCGSAGLHLKAALPAIGTVFTTHATMLGRSIASRRQTTAAALAGTSPEELARELGVAAKHSMEGVCARELDVFTTVSELTADEAERLHRRRPEPVLPNGIDLGVFDELAGSEPREAVAARLRWFAGRFLGEDVGDAALVCTAGRYEHHNKGLDLLIDAMARLERSDGRRIVLFVLVPAGNSGPRAELLERLRDDDGGSAGPLGVSTHNLFDPEHDPVLLHCARVGIDNRQNRRIKLIQLPIYLPDEPPLDLPYEAVLRAMDLSCFPSFYEPWGYTPGESLAVGVPTITTDCAGIGRFAQSEGLSQGDGIVVLERKDSSWDDAVAGLASAIERMLARDADPAGVVAACRETAQRMAWSDLIVNYETAFARATAAAGARVGPRPTRPKARLSALSVAPVPVGQRPLLRRFDVVPTLPAELRALAELGRNVWWTWDAEAQRLFAELSPRFCELGQNPIALLEDLQPKELAARAGDRDWVARLDRVAARFRDYLGRDKQAIPLGDGAELSWDHPVAYFCAEFGLHESIPIYGGGLGILAGDHLKSASDLDVPLCGIGLFYRKGYFKQRLRVDGDQLAEEVEADPAELPMTPVLDPDGRPLRLQLQLPGSTLALAAWRIDVGRVPLYLLDSDLPENAAEDRGVTHHLYGGDRENRLRQEIVLGRGGTRLLQRLGIEPVAYHLNEGHAAFVVLERMAWLQRKQGLRFSAARELVRATTAFTTHTPIPAGHDRFDEALMRRYFSDIEHWAGIPWEQFYAFGQGDDRAPEFNMTYLANHFAGFVNGVSRLHGTVSKRLLHPVWPMLLEGEVPVRAITNGVHLPTWTDPAIGELLGAHERAVCGADFRGATDLPSSELWAARRRLREELLAEVERTLEAACSRRHENISGVRRVLECLREDCLLIGFARRFAPYKRGDLLLRDLDSLCRLVDDEARPVRFLFAGKAHPQDGAGQEILRRIAAAARSPELRGKLVLLEGYDMRLARALVRGVDVWLNNPVRLLEASGTSGMKAAANGVLNLSVADGWWPEGSDGANGWTIGDARCLPSQELQDDLEAAHLYRLLEEEIVPLYFDRDQHGRPEGWLARVRRSLATLPPVFDTDRMVAQYRDLAYAELARSRHLLTRDGKSELGRVVERHERVRADFATAKIEGLEVTDQRDLRVESGLEVRVAVDLGKLSPDDVEVELVVVHPRTDEPVPDVVVVPLQALDGGAGESAGAAGTGARSYGGHHVLTRSGRLEYGVRIRAARREPWDRALDDLVLWANSVAG